MITKELEQAIRFSKSGDHKAALPILKTILMRDPKNEEAWLCLAVCIDDENKSLECLERAHKINPNNELTKKLVLKKLKDIEIENLQLPSQIELPFKESDQGNQSIEIDENPDESFETSNSDDLYPEDESIHSTKNKIEPSSRTYHFAANEDEDQELSECIAESNQQLEPMARIETGIYGKSLIVAGVKIAFDEPPSCLRVASDFDENACDTCEYFSPNECLLKIDENLIGDLNRITLTGIERNVAANRRKNIIVTLVYEELKAHGRPLHYSVITKIITGRYPKLNVTEDSIYHLIHRHAEMFESIGEGVYQAKR